MGEGLERDSMRHLDLLNWIFFEPGGVGGFEIGPADPEVAEGLNVAVLDFAETEGGEFLIGIRRACKHP